MTHSPLPWYAGSPLGYGELKGIEIQDEAGFTLAVTIGDVPSLDSKANAAFIVRAVNSHAELVEALNTLLILYGAGFANDARDMARAALARAKVQP